MCGIVGVIDPKGLTQQQAKWFRQALLIDTVRGEDSTGVMGRYMKTNKTTWLKQAVSGGVFVDNKKFVDNWIGKAHGFDAMIGHNRAATMGSVTTANAHPFEHGAVTLVHNGTLMDTSPMPHYDKAISVDSEMIAFNLSEEDPDNAKLILEKLDGAFTLVWLDSRDDSINIIRNDERPLHVCTGKHNDAMYFMSEGAMLHATLVRTPLNVGPIYSLATQVHLKFILGADAPIATTVGAYIPPRGTSHYQTSQEYWDKYDDEKSWKHTPMGQRNSQTHDPRKEIALLDPKDSTPFQMVMGADRSKRQTVPYQLRETLEWLDLSPEWHLPFMADTFTPYKDDSDRGTLEGYVYVPAFLTWENAVIEGVKESLVTEKDITVRPMIGLFGPKQEIYIRCHFVCAQHTLRVFDNFQKEIGEFNGDPEPEEQESFELNDPEDVVLGPWGSYVSIGAFETLVVDGCTMCGVGIHPDESLQIEWVGDQQNMPVCQKCVNNWKAVNVTDHDDIPF